ncbi:MAG TPA: hypothetical protein VF412_00130 [Bdellovibrio sp.]|uniref:hypothetical protein n=1 Tax=Bdellovibrio sp. TaxID=28201 RepID=UPI002EE6492B
MNNISLRLDSVVLIAAQWALQFTIAYQLVIWISYQNYVGQSVSMQGDQVFSKLLGLASYSKNALEIAWVCSWAITFFLYKRLESSSSERVVLVCAPIFSIGYFLYSTGFGLH